MGHAKLAVLISRNWSGGGRCRFGGSLVPLAPLPLTLCEGRIGCAGGVGDYQIAPLPPCGGKGRCARRARIYLFLSLRHGRTNNFCHSSRQRQRKAVLAQSGERQRSGKRRLREGKRGRQRTGIARRGSAETQFLPALLVTFVAVGKSDPSETRSRARARNYPRRRQIMRLRRCAATPHPPPSGAPSPQGEGFGGWR